jgi:hypothetical protein
MFHRHLHGRLLLGLTFERRDIRTIDLGCSLDVVGCDRSFHDHSCGHHLRQVRSAWVAKHSHQSGRSISAGHLPLAEELLILFHRAEIDALWRWEKAMGVQTTT